MNLSRWEIPNSPVCFVDMLWRKRRVLFLAVRAISKVRMMIYVYRLVYHSCRAVLYLRAVTTERQPWAVWPRAELIVVRVDSRKKKKKTNPISKMTFRRGLPGAFVLIKKSIVTQLKRQRFWRAGPLFGDGRDLFCRMKELLEEETWPSAPFTL